MTMLLIVPDPSTVEPSMTPSVEGGVTCANHVGQNRGVVKHASIDAVRACHLGYHFACGWLYQRTDWVGDDENGYEPYVHIVECGALGWATTRGWVCENGHDYVDMQTRSTEGWDYVHDEQEAKSLRKHGVDAVAMNGSSI